MITEETANLPGEEQIDAALELHKKIGDWQRKDDVLKTTERT